jgi:hypothetical protein
MTRFGDFELQQRAGRDGPFTLFRARQVSLGRPVTLKVLPDRTRTLERTDLLRREAAAADRLDHPGVVRVYEHGDVGGIPYLAQAPVEGETLAARLRTGPVPPRLALDLTRQLAEAVAYAHDRGVLHGSLRPEAVWLTIDGRVRLCGFGCPVLFEELDEEAVANWAGFLAPEQAGARGAVGKATDVYGVGALLYAMATGVPPHRGATVAETCRLIRGRPAVRPSRLHPGLSQALDEICIRCLRTAPSRRYGPERALTRLLADLRKAGGGRAEPVPDLMLWLRRHTRLVRAAMLVLVMGVVPALWDRQRQRVAWDRLTDADISTELQERAARRFERQAAERPFAPEAEAGLTLARFRTGGPLPRGPAWRDVTDEWDAIRALTHVLATAKQGKRSDARDALRSARSLGYEPRTEIERRLLRECDDAVVGN